MELICCRSWCNMPSSRNLFIAGDLIPDSTKRAKWNFCTPSCLNLVPKSKYPLHLTIMLNNVLPLTTFNGLSWHVLVCTDSYWARLSFPILSQMFKNRLAPWLGLVLHRVKLEIPNSDSSRLV